MVNSSKTTDLVQRLRKAEAHRMSAFGIRDVVSGLLIEAAELLERYDRITQLHRGVDDVD